MARDSAVGRERVLIVPGNLTLDNAANQHAGGSQTDLNQQILEVSVNVPLSREHILVSSNTYFNHNNTFYEQTDKSEIKRCIESNEKKKKLK